MDYEQFKAQIRSFINLDLNCYKEQQMQRRIRQWISRYNLEDFQDLTQKIRSDHDHKNKFIEYLTINTSHFFRDEKVFAYIADHVLPDIAKTSRAKIWSAGCSIGAEAYTIVMLLLERDLRFQKLLATDVDEYILSQAKAGIYQANQVAHVPPHLLKEYFTHDEKYYTISDDIKRYVSFNRHNLLTDHYDTGYDLILCRNVFIYFTSEVQKELTSRFVQALRPGGYFVVGSAEQIMNPNSFGLTRTNYCIYQKQ